MRERIRNYELMFIISPLYADEEQIETIISRLQDAIESFHGQVVSVNYGPPWGRRKLAYPIRAYAGGEASRRIFNEGFYVLMNLNLASLRVQDLERTIKYIDPILRHLLVLVESSGQVSRESDQDEEGMVVDFDEAELDEEDFDEGEAEDEAELDEEDLDEDEADVEDEESEAEYEEAGTDSQESEIEEPSQESETVETERRA